MRVALGRGSHIELGDLVAKAGEGSIYAVAGHQDWAAKIFHPTLKDLSSKLEKVAAMIEATPPGATQPDGFAVLTWPFDLVVDGDEPVGYVMPRIQITDAVEIHALSNPSSRSNPLAAAPQWTRHATWQHLVTVATNLSLAVQIAHQVDVVIGDLQERNILVSDSSRVTLVDCDSMQFTSDAGTTYLCAVGRSEFTAPELAQIDLRKQARKKSSDLFSLAVHIHLLLMGGNHPFMRGEWTGDGDQPSALKLASMGDWAGGPRSRLHTHPLAPPPDFLPDNVHRLFIRAFTDGVSDPDLRPSAAQWRAALSDIRITDCDAGAHQVPVGCDTCPWCAIRENRSARRAITAPVSQSENEAARPMTAAPDEPVTEEQRRTEAGHSGRRRTRRWMVAAAAVAMTPLIVGGLIVAGKHGGPTDFTGHTAPASTVSSMSLDGKPVIVSGGEDSTVRVWNAETGRQIKKITESGKVFAVTGMTVDGSPTVVSGNETGAISLWDARTGRQIRQIVGHQGRVSALAATTLDGSAIVISGGNDRSVRLWDAADGRQVRELQGNTDHVSSIATADLDGTVVVVTSSEDGLVRLWDAHSGQQIRRMTSVHETGVHSVAVLDVDGTPVIAGAAMNHVTLWDARTGSEIRDIGLPGAVEDVVGVSAIDLDGTPAIVAAGAGMRVFYARTGEMLQDLSPGNASAVTAMTVDGAPLVVASTWSGTVRTWDPRSLTQYLGSLLD